jgi:hypothetical protein
VWAIGPLAAAIAALAWASPAGAQVIDGPCFGEGHWVDSGQDEDTEEHSQKDVIEVPRADTVQWFGSENDAPLGSEGPEREIEGEVQLDLPIGTVTIDSWGPNDSIRYANEGEHEYDLPSVLVGVEMPLHGEHRENGEVVCSGEVTVVVAGSATDNPLLFAGVGAIAVALVLLYLAGRGPTFTQVRPTFEDVNPG